jgi:hypothetical protein
MSKPAKREILFGGILSPILSPPSANGERTRQHSDALCAPKRHNGPLTPAFSPSEGETGVWTFFKVKKGQPRRGCITQPRVARGALPWVCAPNKPPTLKEEVRRRCEEVDRGTVELRDAEAVFARAYEALR